MECKFQISISSNLKNIYPQVRILSLTVSSRKRRKRRSDGNVVKETELNVVMEKSTTLSGLKA